MQLLRMLRRCSERAAELGTPHLAAFAQLAAARFALLHHVAPSDSGLHAPPGALTAAATATTSATAGVAATGTASGQSGSGGGGGGGGGGEAAEGGELRPAPVMVATALRSIRAAATAASLSAAAPVTPAVPPPATADGSVPAAPPRAAAAADLYTSPALFDRTTPAGAAVAAADAVQSLAGAAHLLQSAAWALHGHSTLQAAHTMMYLAAYSDRGLGCGAPARFEDRSTACAQLLAAAARRGPAAADAAAEACFGLLTVTEEEEQPGIGAGAGGEVVGGGGGVGRAAAEGGWALWGGPALAAAWLAAAHERALAHGDAAAAAVWAEQMAALADPQPHRDVDIRCGLEKRTGRETPHVHARQLPWTIPILRPRRWPPAHTNRSTSVRT